MTFTPTFTRESAVAIDVKLAELHAAMANQQQNKLTATATIRRIAGQRQDRQGRWTGTFDEAISYRNIHHLATYEATQQDAAIQRLDAAKRELARLDAQALELDAQYILHGRWSRFFLVQNNNGHIHSGMGCSTCHPTTQFAWLPELSGLTEADAVEAYGAILCSVCFPSAPVEWTNGISKAAQKAQDERVAAKAERDAKKAAKALLEPVRVPHETLRTVAAAKMWLTDAYWWGPNHQSYPLADRTTVAQALADKLGTTVAVELDAAFTRAAKRK